MKNVYVLIFVFFNYSAVAQSNLLNAKNPDDITNTISVKDTDNFLDYEDIDEKDILWSKIVYELIDLDQKLNHPFLFPLNDEENFIERKSLWRSIKEIIKEKLEYKPDDSLHNSLPPEKLSIYKDDKFTSKLSRKEIYNLIWYPRFNRKENKTEELSIQSGSVGSYEIKGVWYFDKKHSELRYRLLGIHARTASIADLKNDVTDPDLNADSGLWIWYPSIREELDKSLVFNERNNNSKISFDELLINRRFDSYIYKYDNVYGNREIEQYIVRRDGETDERLKLRRILESERIKKEILDFEIDMWGY